MLKAGAKRYNDLNNGWITDRALALKEASWIEKGKPVPETMEWHVANVENKMQEQAGSLLNGTARLHCHAYACSLGDFSKFMSRESQEASAAARGKGDSAYVLKDGGGPFTPEFWLQQRIGLVRIGAAPGDIWWWKAEKAAVRYLWQNGISTCNVNEGGGGGGDTTCSVVVEIFDFVNFHSVFQRRGEYNEAHPDQRV